MGRNAPAIHGIEYGDIQMLKLFLDNGFDIRDTDECNTNAFHLAVWSIEDKGRQFFSYFKAHHEDENCYGCASNPKLHHPEKVDLILDAYGDDTETAITHIFMSKNKFGVTPFQLACAVGCDRIIRKFLSLLDNAQVDIPVEMLMDKKKNNIFHFIIKSSEHYINPMRVGTLKEMLEKLPHVHELLRIVNKGCCGPSGTPIQRILSICFDLHALIPLAIQIAQYSDPFDDVAPPRDLFLHQAIHTQHADLVQALLKAGCDVNVRNPGSFSTLADAIFQPDYCSMFEKLKRPSIRIIELLLAYGFDLQKELYLYTIDEKLIEYSNPKNAKLIDISNIQPDILDALRELRRSNAMFSLKNQCRSFIRRQLKSQKVDEMIEQLEIPVDLKRFLKVEDELGMLGIKEYTITVIRYQRITCMVLIAYMSYFVMWHLYIFLHSLSDVLIYYFIIFVTSLLFTTQLIKLVSYMQFLRKIHVIVTC